jgi:hypothetical protein
VSASGADRGTRLARPQSLSTFRKPIVAVSATILCENALPGLTRLTLRPSAYEGLLARAQVLSGRADVDLVSASTNTKS